MGKTSIHLMLSWLAVWACGAPAGERVLLEFDTRHAPPPDWRVQGYAFGTHDSEPEYRQRAAVASRNQRQSAPVAFGGIVDEIALPRPRIAWVNREDKSLLPHSTTEKL